MHSHSHNDMAAVAKAVLRGGKDWLGK